MSNKKKNMSCTLRILIALVLIIAAVSYYRYWDVAANENKYDQLIVQYARENSLPPSLVKAVIRKESKFHPRMRGKAGEYGLMQLMPGAVKDWSKNTKHIYPFNWQLYDPALNIEIGTWYLARCCNRYKNYASHYELGLSEYNAGYSRAQKWKPQTPETPINLNTDITINSTRKYIRAVLDFQKKYTLLDRQ